MNNLTLLILGGGIEAVQGIKIAKKMGLEVIVCDGDPNAPGFLFADKVFVIDTYDSKGIIKESQSYNRENSNISGVIAMAADVPHIVAEVAQGLNLQGQDIEMAHLCVNKLKMKNHFKKNGIPVPWFAAIKDFEDFEKLVAKHNFPLVIKPIDSRGARGVLKLEKNINLKWAFETSLKESPSKQVMLEYFIKGPQVSTETLIINGKCYTFGYSDRNYQRLDEFAPYIIEDGGDLPGFCEGTARLDTENLIKKTVGSLGIQNGVLKGDIVFQNNKPLIIEVAPRLSGGHFCTYEIPFSTGIPFIENAILLSLQKPVPPQNLKPFSTEKFICQRYLFLKPGTIINIESENIIKNNPSILYFELRVKNGDKISKINNHTSRSGMVIATGKSRKEAEKSAREAIKSLIIKII